MFCVNLTLQQRARASKWLRCAPHEKYGEIAANAEFSELANISRDGRPWVLIIWWVTWLMLLRVRHRIDSKGKLGPKFAMAEEAAAIAFSASSKQPVLWNTDAFALLDRDGENLDENTRRLQIERAISSFESLQPALSKFAHERSEVLAGDHIRVRQALGSKGQVKVSAITPVDIIGFYLLMPGL